VPYTEAFKAQMVRRMVGPPKKSATSLAKEVGVSQAQLSRWRLKAVGRAVMAIDERVVNGEARKWTAEEKFRLLVKAEGLEGEALGALLRGEGLHESQLRAWREAAAGALGAEAASSGAKAGERRTAAEAKKRIKELERELGRKEKALAEAAALLILEKKLQTLGWGNGDGGTGERNDE
jgi:transposase